jgi:hypothetical protein
VITWIRDFDTVYEVATGADRSFRGPLARERGVAIRSLVATRESAEIVRKIVLGLDPTAALRRAGDPELTERFQRLVATGEVEIRSVHRRLHAVGGRTLGPTADATTPLAEVSPPHFVEFRVVDPQGRPIGALPYVLHEPDGARTHGALGSDGRVRRDDVDDDVYGLELEDVEAVTWGLDRALCDADIPLFARVSGCDDGTKVAVRIFREASETDDDVVDTFEAEVIEGGVATTWRYDYAADEARASEVGEVRFIAEVSVPGGRAWGKTVVPITIVLKAIAIADWDRDKAEPGTEVELHADTTGFAEGTTATITVYSVGPQGGGKAIASLAELPMVGGRVTTRWAVPSEPGELYFEVAIDDVVSRVGVSDFLVVARADRPRRGRKASGVSSSTSASPTGA